MPPCCPPARRPIRSAVIADATCSATTLRCRRDERIAAGVMEALQALALAAYDRMIGLALDEVAIDCCITKAPCGGEVAGRSPVDRGKPGRKRSVAVDAAGIPLATIAAPANRHDSPLLEPTLDALGFGDRPMTVHLDRGYDSGATRMRLASRGLMAAITAKGMPASITASQRWVVERTNAWSNAHMVHRTPGHRGRVLDRLLGGDHHRRAPRSPSVDSLPLGNSATPQAVTPPLLAQALRPGRSFPLSMRLEERVSQLVSG